MIKSWDAFIAYLCEVQQCELIDDLDWGYPIYRCSSNGKECGLDLDSDIDDFLICSICDRLGIPVPDGHDGEIEAIRQIKNDINKN